MQRINKVQLYSIIIFLFMFQPVIERYIGFFKYYDEIVAMISFVSYLATSKLKFGKYDLQILLGFMLLCTIGIVGNIWSKSGQVIPAVIQDMISNGKMILYALSIRYVHLNEKQKTNLADTIVFIIRFLFITMFITAVLSQFINIGMTDKARYGIKSYKFIFNNPAGLNTYCYLYMILNSITVLKNGKLRKHSTLFTLMGVIPWVLTMRSRAIAFATIYLALYFYILYIRKPGSAFKFKWYQVIIVAATAMLLCWDAIETYFIANDRVARYNLSRTAFRIATDYFPIGTGFGTYGTEASRAYYSSVYAKYGLNHIYGLTGENSMFITDQFWFGVIGQFGLIGTIVLVGLMFRTYKNIWSISKWEKNSQLACLILFYTSIFASLTAGTFIQASILPSILVIYLLCNNQKYKKGQHGQ